jgi:hypothetical protein
MVAGFSISYPMGTLGGARRDRDEELGTVNVKHSVIFISAIILITQQYGSAQADTVRTASLPHVDVAVTITRTSGGQPMLIENFTTDSPHKHSLCCISGFLDMKYVLRDSTSKIIPVSSKGGADRVAGNGDTGAAFSSNGKPVTTPDPCKTIDSNAEQRRVLIPDLYPQLAHGTYTLQVILAPRDTAERAALSPPFTVKI